MKERTPKGLPRILTIPVPTPFPVGPVNVYLVAADPVTLIDTGPLTDNAWEALKRGLDSAGYKPEDVKRVLLTHGHQDHFGLAERLTRLGAVAYGGLADRAPFRMHRETRLLLDRLSRAGFGLGDRFGMVASVAWVDSFSRPLTDWAPLQGGETLPGDGWSVKVRAAPGHTPGSLTFELEGAGIVFSGDTVLAHITPNAIVDEDPDRPGETFRSVSRYFETLERLAGVYGEARMKTGHGEEIGHFGRHFSEVTERYRRRIVQLEKSLAGSPRSVREIVLDLFPRVSHVNVFLAFSEVLGFLMYLEDEGRVERFSGGLVDRYRLVAARHR